MPDSFTLLADGYFDCALWSSLRDDGSPLDDNYVRRDIDPIGRHVMMQDCTLFFKRAQEFISDETLLTDTLPFYRAGVDFWLTRNHHGCGFWDGDWREPEATRLDEIAKSFGKQDLYVGDDGMVHVFP